MGLPHCGSPHTFSLKGIPMDLIVSFVIFIACMAASLVAGFSMLVPLALGFVLGDTTGISSLAGAAQPFGARLRAVGSCSVAAHSRLCHCEEPKVV